MGEILFKIWFLIVILPFTIVTEGSKMFSNFLKRKNIYSHWDILHSFLFILIILFIILRLNGYR
jgi:hypothetical protein